MAEKVTVTINKHDGKTVSIPGNTVIVFAINDAAEMVEGAKGMAARVIQTGDEIPTLIFPDVISRIVGSLVKQTYKEHPMLAAFQLSSIADSLNEQCDKINKNIRDSVDDEKELNDMFEGLLRTIFD